MSDQVGAYFGSSYGLRPGDYRRVWNAGNTIGRAARNYLMRKPTQPMAPRGPRKRSRAVEKVRRALRAKRPLRLQSVTPTGVAGPGSESSFNYPWNKKPDCSKLVAQQTYIGTAGSSCLTTGIGLQNFANIVPIHNATDLNAMFGLAGVTTEQKILYNSFRTEVEFANPLNINQRIKIWDLEVKRDFTNTTVSNPLTFLRLAQGDIAGGTATSDTEIIGFDPTDCAGFLQYFAIKNCTEVFLAPGQVHYHRVKGAPQKMLDSDVNKYSTAGMKGFTRWVFVQLIPQIGNDVNTETQVTTFAGRMNYRATTVYKYSILSTATRRFDYGSALPTAFSAGGRVEEEYVEGAEVAATT